VKVDESKSAAKQSKAIAARQTEETEHAITLETPPPGTPLLFDITTDATSPAHGEGLPDPQPDFWYYQLDIMEYWNGDLLQATGDLHGVGVNHRFHFSGTDTFMWAKINDKYLHIEYDFHNHCKPRQVSLDHQIVLTYQGPILGTTGTPGAWTFMQRLDEACAGRRRIRAGANPHSLTKHRPVTPG
jgi:hypothetical protein